MYLYGIERSGYMNEDEKNEKLSMKILWWIFKEAVKTLNLTKEEKEKIKRKLEEKLYGQQSDT